MDSGRDVGIALSLNLGFTRSKSTKLTVMTFGKASTLVWMACKVLSGSGFPSRNSNPKSKSAPKATHLVARISYSWINLWGTGYFWSLGASWIAVHHALDSQGIKHSGSPFAFRRQQSPAGRRY